MKLPEFIRRRLLAHALRVMASRETDIKIGGKADTYSSRKLGEALGHEGIVEEGAQVERWMRFQRNDYFNIYYHKFLRSDEDEAPHDHEYLNISAVLGGEDGQEEGYWEAIHGQYCWRPSGSIVIRLPSTLHRVEINDVPIITIFICGPRVREWGFMCKQGWVHHAHFLRDKDATGKGC